jgi:hypothetical protein
VERRSLFMLWSTRLISWLSCIPTAARIKTSVVERSSILLCTLYLSITKDIIIVAVLVTIGCKFGGMELVFAHFCVRLSFTGVAKKKQPYAICLELSRATES